MGDQFDLDRFVDAQESIYETVVGELRAGRKRSHWMWFVFPQLRELGRSATAKRFGIVSRDEAVAYLAHAMLGPRLRECSQVLMTLEVDSADVVMGAVDAMKLRSSMTLFARATADCGDFVAVLDKYYGGRADPMTIELLGSR